MTAQKRRSTAVTSWDVGDTIPAHVDTVDDVGAIRWYRTTPGGRMWHDEPGFDVLPEDELLRTYGPVTVVS